MLLELFVPVGVVGTIAVGLFLIYQFAEQTRVLRAMRKVPRCAVAAARDGEVVRVVGRIRLFGNQLVAPLSRRPCAYCLLQVTGIDHGTNSDGDLQDLWLFDATGCGDIAVEDDTGPALVRLSTQPAVVVLVQNLHRMTVDTRQPGIREYLDEGLLRMLRERKISLDKLRISETVLLPGDIVAVVGRCQIVQEPGGLHASYREAPRNVYLGPYGEKIMLTEDPALIAPDRPGPRAEPGVADPGPGSPPGAAQPAPGARQHQQDEGSE